MPERLELPKFAATSLMGMIVTRSTLLPALTGDEPEDPETLADPITDLFLRAVTPGECSRLDRLAILSPHMAMTVVPWACPSPTCPTALGPSSSVNPLSMTGLSLPASTRSLRAIKSLAR